MTPTLQTPTHFRLPNWSFQSKTPPSRLDIIWLLMSVSMLSFIGNYFADGRSPLLSHILAISSCTGCGLSWLLSRALFREAESDERWTYGVVGTLFVIGCILYVTAQLGISRDGFLGFVARISALISSTMLLLPIFESIDGFSKQNSKERIFRVGFLGCYGLILTIAMLVSMPAFAGIEHPVQVSMSGFALLGTAFAVNYRKRLSAEVHKAREEARSDDADAKRIATALVTLLEDQRVYLQPTIKVSHIARQLGTAQYKVTRCITGPLGYANFNQMINAYRIAEAKRLLADARNDDHSILCIAMDSGFGSIGPFNRAFKQSTGMTPMKYRKSCKDFEARHPES